MSENLTQSLAEELPLVGSRSRGVFGRALGLWRTRIGIVIALVLVALAIFGPYFAPHGPSDLVGLPFQQPGPGVLLGTDQLGQDVWSRFLDGGRSILLVSVISTVLGVGAGVLVGLWAALSGGWVDNTLLRVTDVLLAFPQILFALIVIATVGPKTWLIVLTVALTTMPRTVRVIRGAAAGVVEREFVDAARAIGDSQLRIVLVEVLPNVVGSLVVEATFRLTYAIQLIAALAFLGFATDPNAPNWGTMVSQNASALTLQPNAALVPAAAIALLTVAVGLIGDGFARASAGLDQGRPMKLEKSAPVVVRVENLRVDVAASGDDIVDHVDLTIGAGEVLALVGESGSGKTTAALALLAHERRGARITHGRITIGEHDMLALRGEQVRSARGRIVSYVPQDPSAALNPARRIGAHLLETLQVHGIGHSDAARRDRIAETLREVSLPDDTAFLRRYPHQLSGGQQQRVTIAMAFACKPSVVVLDEPTTGLDVTTQAHVLATIRRITAAEGAAALYVSHDLSVVSSLADRVAVMYAGRVVEEGPAAEVFAAAAHPYTRLLLAAVPRMDAARTLTAIPGRAPNPGSRPPGCPFAARCTLHIAECDERLPEAVAVGDRHTVRCIRVADARATIATSDTLLAARTADAPAPVVEVADLAVSYGRNLVVEGVGFSIDERECVALVGESGSGKTTVSRAIAGLHDTWSGQIRLRGEPLAPSARHRPRSAKRELQYVFQNPYGSLNPRRTVGQSVARPLALLDVPRRDVRQRVGEMLERVSLPPSYQSRYPDELSGGERQRVAIARALICRPRVLLCDEVTSALDVSVQASIVSLLRGLQDELGLGILFVTHNLPLVRSIAQRVVVLRQGRIVESGDVTQVLERPVADYTRRLLADAPRLAQAAR